MKHVKPARVLPRRMYDDQTIRAVVLYGDDAAVPSRTAKEWRAHWRAHGNRIMK